MRLAPLLFAAALAALPQGLAAQELPPPLLLRSALPATGGDSLVPKAAVPPSATPAAEADPIETGAVPRLNPRVAAVAPEAPEPPVSPLRRIAEEDQPFAATGIAAGSFLLFPAVTVGAGYTTSADGAAGSPPSGLFTISPELLIRSNWADDELTLSLRGTWERTPEGTPGEALAAEAAATARIDLADRWSVDLAGSYALDQQSVSDPTFPAGADDAPDVHSFSGKVGLNRAFGRGAFTLEGRAERSVHEDAHAGALVIDQSDRDNTLYGGRVRLGYELTPAVAPFVEAEVTRRVYDEELDASGLARASDGWAARAGLAFNSGPVLSGEIAIGTRQEDFDDPALASLRALTVDGSLVWSPTPLVTVTADLATLISPTTDPAASGSIVYDGELGLAYAVRRNVTLDLTGGLRHERFDGGGVERTWRAGAGVTWKISRTLWLTGAYEHTWLDSDTPGRSYEADEIRVDLRLQR